MNKIFLFLAAMCMLVACDPVSEDISNDGNITLDQLKQQSSVSLKGNEIFCTTSAPVNAKWTIDDKDFLGNYAWKKTKLGEHNVLLTALCADGTILTNNYPLTVTEITNPLEKFYIYGGPDRPEDQPFSPGAWDAGAMRFSSTEGKYFPTIDDAIYFGKKTLIFDISDATDDCYGRVMNGWWSARYDDDIDVHFTNGLWELPITDKMAHECAKGGEGRDLDLMITSGSCTINSVYYEE